MSPKPTISIKSPSPKAIVSVLVVLFLIVFNFNHRPKTTKAQREFDIWADSFVSNEPAKRPALPSFSLEIFLGDKKEIWTLAPDGTQKTGEHILRLLELSREANVLSVSEETSEETHSDDVRVGIEAGGRKYNIPLNKETVKTDLKIGLLLRLIKEYGSNKPETLVSKNLTKETPNEKKNIQ